MGKPIIRVTTLESFRSYMSGMYSYKTEQDVIDGITQKFEGNEYTRIGTAFHSIVETGDCGERVPAGERRFLCRGREMAEPVPCGRKFVIDGEEIIFDDGQCGVALDYRGEYPDAFHEIRERKDYGEAIVTGCADMICGLQVRDIKTKCSAVSDEDYIDSCQWRFYLDLFGADEFHFDLFVFDGYRKERHGTDVRGLALTRHEPAITCYRYQGMEDENKALIAEFLRWAEYRNLLKYFYG